MKRVKDTAAALSLTIFIISFSVMFTLAFRPLYYFDVNYLDIPGQSGYSGEEIRENYDALIRYNLSPFEKKLEFPTLAMSREGEIHFQEVKAIFQFFLGLMLSGGLLSVFFISRSRRKKEYGYLKGAGVLTLAIPLALGIFLAIGWDRAFVLFHEIAFRNDYWLFDPATDPVITILPDTFFFHCALMILALLGVGAAICLVLSRRIQISEKKKHC